MAIPTLMNTLKACYGANQNTNPIFIATLKENLASDISVTQAKTLANRLVASYKFSPSISEIVAEWKAMRMAGNRRVYEATPVSTTMSPETKRRVTETMDRIRENRPKEYGAMSSHVMDFARQFFPDISEATARRNCLDIMNCMSTREAEIAAGSPYRTYMELNDNGMITLVIRKIA